MGYLGTTGAAPRYPWPCISHTLCLLILTHSVWVLHGPEGSAVVSLNTLFSPRNHKNSCLVERTAVNVVPYMLLYSHLANVYPFDTILQGTCCHLYACMPSPYPSAMQQPSYASLPELGNKLQGHYQSLIEAETSHPSLHPT